MGFNPATSFSLGPGQAADPSGSFAPAPRHDGGQENDEPQPQLELVLADGNVESEPNVIGNEADQVMDDDGPTPVLRDLQLNSPAPRQANTEAKAPSGMQAGIKEKHRKRQALLDAQLDETARSTRTLFKI